MNIPILTAFDGVFVCNGDTTEIAYYTKPEVWQLGKLTKQLFLTLSMSNFTTTSSGTVAFRLTVESSNDGKRWATDDAIELVSYANGTSANYANKTKSANTAATAIYGPYIRLVLYIKATAGTVAQSITALIDVTGKAY